MGRCWRSGRDKARKISFLTCKRCTISSVMEKAHFQEFQQLCNSALEQLENVAASSSYECVFSFWTLPSFSDQSRATLYTPRRDKARLASFVEFAVWKRDVDAEKFRTPLDRLKHPKELKPTIETSTRELGHDLVSAVINDLKQVSLSCLRPDESMLGTDGTRYRFKADQGYFGLDLSWWCDGPMQWREAIQKLRTSVARVEG